jgi:hypothetical protein
MSDEFDGQLCQKCRLISANPENLRKLVSDDGRKFQRVGKLATGEDFLWKAVRAKGIFHIDCHPWPVGYVKVPPKTTPFLRCSIFVC